MYQNEYLKYTYHKYDRKMKLKPSGNTFTARFKSGKKSTFLKGISLLEIMDYERPEHPDTIILARVNNIILDLKQKIQDDCIIEWLTADSSEYKRSNQQTICLVLIRAVNELFPDKELLIDHSLGKGLYCELKNGIKLSRRKTRKIEKRMLELIAADDPIDSLNVRREKALDILEARHEKRAWLAGNELVSTLTLYRYGNTIDYLGYPLHINTRHLSDFNLEHWSPGFILNIPDDEEIHPCPPEIKQKKLFQVFHEYGRWEGIYGIETVANMNEAVQDKSVFDLIKIAEGLHEKKFAAISDQITRKRKSLRVILIAGPSSSGKTTFTKRLTIQLLVNGLNPHTISLDDYFLDRDKTPVDKDGKHQFESLEAIDVPRFNEDLIALLEGKTVQLPKYDFIEGKSVEGDTIQVGRNQPILIEGLHGLNEKLSSRIRQKNKLKIYVSALTQLNVTNHLRVPTSDVRLLRRMVRDAKFRNYTAHETIERWPEVRRGEEINIFPFQEEADIIFNTSLMYELAILRSVAVPLLESVKPGQSTYPEAQRLLQFLLCFLPISADCVPLNSMLREFIGKSSFHY